MSEDFVNVLLYSDDSDVRQHVKNAIGVRPGKGLPTVNWIEAATAPAAVEYAHTEDLAAMILDGETGKTGGMAVSRQIDGELDDAPTKIVLTARPQDDWLALGAGADVTVAAPYDPIELQERLADAIRDRAQ